MIYLPTQRIREAVRTIHDRLDPSAVVLTYHRVAENIADPQRLAVHPAKFSQHLEVLADITRPVPLEELPERMKNRSPDDLPLSAVTFDDGYADNMSIALPILKQHGIPATVFVASSTIESDSEFWWDALERILLQPRLPEELTLRIGGETRTWSFRQDAVLIRAFWDVYMEPRLTAHEAYLYICGRMRMLSEEEQADVMNQLYEWSGIDRRARENYRTFTAAQLKQIAQDKLITIGAHTVNHLNLANIGRDSQFFEIEEGKARLEQLLGCPVKTFAYPYGREEDYCRCTVKFVRKAGFSCACTTIPHMVSRWTDPLQMPRFSVGNWNGNIFRRKLAEFMLMNLNETAHFNMEKTGNDERFVREGTG
jgi:peptidoglycan/xylan/chitin deacetylase (PgdA/CDA1 family)